MIRRKRALLTLALAGLFLSPSLLAGEAEKSIEDLGSNQSTVRNNAIKAIQEMGSEAYDDVLAGLEGDDLGIAAICARLLGTLGDTRGIDPLLTALNSEDEDRVALRCAAASALAQLAAEKPERLNEVHTALMPSEDSEIPLTERMARLNAATSLPYTEPSHTSMMLALDTQLASELTSDASPAFGMLAVSWLAKRPATTSTPLLKTFIDAKGEKAEDDDAETPWAFEGKGWDEVRLQAIFVLADNNADGSEELLTEEILSGRRIGNLAARRLSELSANFGADLANRIVSRLKEGLSGDARTKAFEVLAGMQAVGMNALMEMAREGEAEQAKQIEEGKDKAINPYLRHFRDAVKTALNRREARDDVASAFEDELAREDAKNDDIAEALLKLFNNSNLRQEKASVVNAACQAVFQTDNIELIKTALDTWYPIARSDDYQIIEDRLLTHESVDVRKAVVETLTKGGLPNFRVQPLLVKAVSDAETDVRKLVWQGLERSNEAEILDVFKEGFTDPAWEVQYAAGKRFGGFLAKVEFDGERLSHEDNRSKRDELTALVREQLEAANGASAGLMRGFVSLNSALFVGSNDEKKADRAALLPAVKKYVAHDDVRLRRAAYGIQANIFDADDQEYINDLAEAFIAEEDVVARRHLCQVFKQKLSLVDSENAKALVTPLSSMLDQSKAKDDEERDWGQIGRDAADVLGQLGKSESQGGKGLFSAVNTAAKDALTAAKNNPTAANVSNDDLSSPYHQAANAIFALSQAGAGGHVQLVIDTLKAYKDAKISGGALSNWGKDYLKNYARLSDLANLEGTGLQSNLIEQIEQAAKARG